MKNSTAGLNINFDFHYMKKLKQNMMMQFLGLINRMDKSGQVLQIASYCTILITESESDRQISVWRFVLRFENKAIFFQSY